MFLWSYVLCQKSTLLCTMPLTAIIKDKNLRIRKELRRSSILLTHILTGPYLILF